MPIEQHWEDDTHQILRFVIRGTWTLEEFNQGVAQAKLMAEARNHPVDVLVDAIESHGIPRGVDIMASLVDIYENFKARYIVMVGGTPVGRAIVQMLARRYRHRTRNIAFAGTINEGHHKIKLLKERDTKHVPRPF